MSRYNLQLTIVLQELDHGVLAESMFYPELSCLRSDRGTALKELVRRLRRFAPTLDRLELPRRQVPIGAVAGSCEVVVRPARKSAAWGSPLKLRFPVVLWRHADASAYQACVPALGIEVIAGSEAEREIELKLEIGSALSRSGALDSLRELVPLQQTRRIRLVPLMRSVGLPTLLQAEREAEKRRQQNKPSVLKKVATELPGRSSEPVYEVDEPVGQLLELLLSEHPKSVLLVGPSGVGKTAIVREFAGRLAQRSPRVRCVWTTSGARLISGMSGFGMWEERCQSVCREAAELQAILHLGNLSELMEVGKSGHSGIGVAGFLRSYLARGEVLAIAECTTEQLPLIERQQPQLLAAFHVVRISEPAREQGLRLLERASHDFHPPGGVPVYEASGPPWIAADALRILDALHRRYATYSAYPGRPLRFLRNVLHDTFPSVARDGTGRFPDRPVGPVTAGEVTQAFARETGLPLFLLDAHVPFHPQQAQAWFQKRVLGQPSVIDLVVDLLGVIKTGLARPGKPLASLLFIGPTGVGKTEMSKAIAHYLFGDPHRMVRFDMSEFHDRLSVQRLIGGIGGSEGLLTARIREQPFAVLLFDEVEKAHPQFFDFLLQVLGEARLTDAGGRLADFRNAVIVMTSNLGASSFQQGSVGFAGNGNAREHAADHFVEEVRRFVRPELFNRIDRVVPFLPLAVDCVREIARGQLRQLELRDGIAQRGVRIDVEAGVADWLATRGYDVRYGARPLKRAIERELLAPLADGINRYSADRALEATVQVAHDALSVHVRAQSDAQGRPVSSAVARPRLVRLAERTVELRRYLQKLEHCPEIQTWRDTLFRLQQLEAQIAKRAGRRGVPVYVASRGDEAKSLERLSALQGQLSGLETLGVDVRLVEELTLRQLYGDARSGDAASSSELTALYAENTDRFERLVMHVYAESLKVSSGVDCLTIAIYAPSREHLFRMVELYEGMLAARQHSYRVFELRTKVPDVDQDRYFPVPKPAKSPVAGKAETPRYFAAAEDDLKNPPSPETAGIVGMAITATGVLVQGRHGPDAGLHLINDTNGKQYEILIDTAACSLDDYRPPEGAEFSWTLERNEKLRKYDLRDESVEDLKTKTRTTFRGRTLLQAVLEMSERRLRRQAYRDVLDLEPFDLALPEPDPAVSREEAAE